MVGPQEQLHTQCERAANRNPAGGPNNQRLQTCRTWLQRDGARDPPGKRYKTQGPHTEPKSNRTRGNRTAGANRTDTPHRLPGLRPVRLCSALALLGPPPMACSPGPPLTTARRQGVCVRTNSSWPEAWVACARGALRKGNHQSTGLPNTENPGSRRALQCQQPRTLGGLAGVTPKVQHQTGQTNRSPPGGLRTCGVPTKGAER